MNTSGEAAEQIVRMSLNGVEVAAKITGRGSLKLASVLYKELKTQKRSKGKQRISTMLRSGRQLKVYGVKDDDLAKFAKEAKKYGFPYCVLKDRDTKDGITDIMVSMDDGSKVARIFERFKMSTVEQSTIKTELDRQKNKDADIPVPDKNPPEKTSKEDNFIDELMKKPAPNHEEGQNKNPTEGRNAKTRQSEPSSRVKNKEAAMGTPDDERTRPSVRKELKEIRTDMEKNASSRKDRNRNQKQNVHIEPKKKPKKNKER